MSKCSCGRFWSRIEYCVTGCKRGHSLDNIAVIEGDPPSPAHRPHHNSNTPPASSNPPDSSSSNPPESISVELLDKLLEILGKQIGDDRSGSSVASVVFTTADIKHYKDFVEASLQGRQADNKKVIEDLEMMVKDSYLPVATQVLQGLGSQHWALVGCTLLALGIDARYKTLQNSQDFRDTVSDVRQSIIHVRMIIAMQSKSMDLVERILSQVLEVAKKAIVLGDSYSKDKCRCLKASYFKDEIANLKALARSVLEQATSIRANVEPFPSIIKMQPSFHDHDNIVGRDEEKHEAMEFLKSSYGSEVRAVCLTGMGGIGKSTLGKAIYKEFYRNNNEGHYVCCREELPLDVKDIDLTYLCACQRNIITKIHNYKDSDVPKIVNCEDGKNHLRDQLCKTTTPIFLYIDNMSNPNHVTELLPASIDLPQGLRILVTTRDIDVSKALQRDLGIKECHSIRIKQLSRDDADLILMHEVHEAWKQHTELDGGFIEDANMGQLRNEVLDLCNGLPLALKVVGASIGYDNPTKRSTWVDVVKSLRDATLPDSRDADKLYKPLKYGITCLDESLRKDLFDVVNLRSSFREPWDIVEPWKIVECVIGERQLGSLVNRHLLEIETDGKYVKCHDVLEALIRRMAEKEYGELHVKKVEELVRLRKKGDLPKVVSLAVGWEDDDVQHVSVRELSEMRGLRYLSGLSIVGTSEEEGSADVVVLPKLRVFHKVVGGSELIDFDACDDLRVIVGDDFRAALKCPSVSKTLTYLRSEVDGANELEAVAACRELRHLCLKLSSGIRCLPSSIGWNLSRLRTLHLVSCLDMEELIEGEETESSCVENLTHLTSFAVYFCPSFRRLPNGIRHLKALQKLHLKYCDALENVPADITQLSALQELVFRNCPRLRSLPEATFQHMIELQLFSCDSLEFIPNSISQCNSLKELFLLNIKKLPDNMFTQHMTDLEELNLGFCRNLEGIPPSVSELRNLKGLYLFRCSKLSSLPRSMFFYMATSLRELNLSYCYALVDVGTSSSITSTELQESLQDMCSDQQDKHQLQSLESLDLSHCGSLRFFRFGTFPRLTHLSLAGGLSSNLVTCILDRAPKKVRYLDLSGNREIHSQLPEATLSCGLTDLILRGCKNLRYLSETRAPHLFTHLRSLDLRNCIALESLPQWICDCESLRVLLLSGCLKLRDLPDGKPEKTMHLEEIDLRGCSNLECLPQWMFCTSLKTLELSGCSMLWSLPYQFNEQHWIHLESLNLCNCSSLGNLSEWICNGPRRLQELDLSGCTQVQAFPHNAFQRMADLKYLRMKDCSSLEHLPESIVELRSLKMLDLSGCSKLANLPDRMFRGMTALEILNLSGCRGLISVPNGSLSSCLEKLSLRQCTNLQLECLPSDTIRYLDLAGNTQLVNLPDALFQHMTSLRQLSLKGCSFLEHLPDNICGLTNLEELDLSGCTRLRTLPQRIFGRMRFLRGVSLKDCASINFDRADEYYSEQQQDSCLDLGHLTMKQPDSDCGNLDDRDMKDLRSLDLSNNERLIWNLHSMDAFHHMSSLCALKMRECGSLQRLPESILKLGRLEVLDLCGCTKLESLPSQLFQTLTALRSLFLGDCVNLNSIPVDGVSGLKELSVRGCNNLGLENILCSESAAAAAVGSLEFLDLSCCDEFFAMRILPQNLFRHMSSLSILKLEGYSRLQYLPDESLQELTKLGELFLSGCTQLESLPERVLEGLWRLELKDCISLRQQLPVGVVAELNRLQKQGFLNVEGCSGELTDLIWESPYPMNMSNQIQKDTTV